MELVVLMAGKGMRFVNAGYTTPKPFIEVKGRTILDWTLSSIGPLLKSNPLSFAIRKDHEEQYGFRNILEKTYGPGLKFIEYDGPVLGNLHTGHFTVTGLLKDKTAPVLFLDSDNKYDIVNFEGLLKSIPEKDFVVLCYFQLEDKNDLKWGFCAVDRQTNKVSELKEKEYLQNGQPMIGVFYWSSAEFFEKIAGETMQQEQPGKNGEYYMTQGISFAIKKGFPVYAFKSNHMVPLGTPEDINKFAQT